MEFLYVSTRDKALATLATPYFFEFFFLALWIEIAIRDLTFGFFSTALNTANTVLSETNQT